MVVFCHILLRGNVIAKFGSLERRLLPTEILNFVSVTTSSSASASSSSSTLLQRYKDCCIKVQSIELFQANNNNSQHYGGELLYTQFSAQQINTSDGSSSSTNSSSNSDSESYYPTSHISNLTVRISSKIMKSQTIQTHQTSIASSTGGNEFFVAQETLPCILPLTEVKHFSLDFFQSLMILLFFTFFIVGDRATSIV